MQKKIIATSTAIAITTVLSGCFEEIKEPTCSDLDANNKEMLKLQEEKYPELMKTLREKCLIKGGGFVPSTATKGLIR